MAEDNLRPAGNGACDLPVDHLESRVGVGRSELPHPQFVTPRQRPSYRWPMHALVFRWLVCALIAGQFACAPSPEDQIAQVRAIHADGRFLDTAETVIELYEKFPNDPEVMRLDSRTGSQSPRTCEPHSDRRNNNQGSVLEGPSQDSAR